LQRREIRGGAARDRFGFIHTPERRFAPAWTLIRFLNCSLGQDHQLIIAQRKLRISASLVIRKLDFKDPQSQIFDDSAELSAIEASVGQISSQGDHVK